MRVKNFNTKHFGFMCLEFPERVRKLYVAGIPHFSLDLLLLCDEFPVKIDFVFTATFNKYFNSYGMYGKDDNEDI